MNNSEFLDNLTEFFASFEKIGKAELEAELREVRV